MTAKKKNSIKKSGSSPATGQSEADQHPGASQTSGRFRSNQWIAAILLFLLSVVLYLQSTGFEYVLDDRIVISENDYVKKGIGGIRDILSTESFSGYFGEQRDLVVGSRYRPLSIITFAIEHQFFGLNPKVSHFVNILLYGLTALLIFRLLFLFFPAAAGEKHWYLSLPFLATLLFVLHPLHTEVVANVKGRDEILCLMGALGSIYLVWKYLAQGNILWLGAAAICFFGALLAKENALTFLAIVPLSIYFFSDASHKKNLTATAVLVGASILYLWLRYQVIGYFLSSGKEITDLMNNPFYGLSAGEKFGTIFYTLGQYLKLLFIPHPLTHDYYPYHIPVVPFGDLRAILPLILYGALTLYALAGVRSKSIPAYGILFYLITLSIVSNIPFTVGTFMNERFMYIPSLGFCLIIAYLISDRIPAWTSENKEELNLLSIGLLLLFVLGYAYKTISRIPDWRSQLSLNTAAVKVSANSARANCFMATSLFNQYNQETDKDRRNQLLDDMNHYLDRSLEILPSYGSAILMKSGIVAENYKRDRDLDKLLDEFSTLIKLDPRLTYIDEYLIYLNGTQADRSKLTGFYFRMGAWFANEYRSSKLALKYLRQYGLSIDPDNRDLNRAVGQIYQSLNKPELAAPFLNKAK